MSETVRVSLDEIEAVTKAALMAHGAHDWIAVEVAKAVRRAEETGNLICGLYYLESYCQQLVSGRVKGGVEPVVTLPKSASVKVDACFGFAQAAFSRGFPKLLEVAKETGTASLAVAHAHTCTSLGYFTEQIAQAGLVGIGFTNAFAVVSPPGGKKPVLGTNPIAMSIPAKDGGIAFQFDQSTSAIARGKITMAAAAGEDIPLGWAVDKDGKPTTDAKAALAGSQSSSGGYKGWGFGLMAEVLAAAMTGSVNSIDVNPLKDPEGPSHDLGQFYIALDPETSAGSDFWLRIERIFEAVNDQEGARLPGATPKSAEFVDLSKKLWDSCLEFSSV